MARLKHSQADITRYLLIAGGLGVLPDGTTDWGISAEGELDAPDKAITVYNTTGIPDGRIMVTGEMVIHLGLQVRIRDNDPRSGYSKANDIRTAMENVRYLGVAVSTGGGVPDSNYTVYCYSNISDVIDLGRNVPHTKRVLFTINAVTSIIQTS